MKVSSIKKRLCYIFLLFAGCAFFITDAFFNSASATDPFGRAELEDTTRTLEIAKSIRDAIQLPDCGEAARILESITEEKSIGEKTYGVVKYTNKEISDAVADLFIYACKIWSNGTERKKWFGETGDDQEWFHELQVYAESTFSPKLYVYEVFYDPWGTNPAYHVPSGRYMIGYLSNVNTSETLRIIINSYLDPPNHNDCLTYSPNKQLTHIDLSKAMEIFSGICKSDPEAMRKESENVRAFIKKHIDHYVKNKTIDPLGGETIDSRGDFEARYAALDVLGFYANPADKDLIQKIANESLAVKEKDKLFPPEYMLQSMQDALESIASSSASKKNNEPKPSGARKK